MSLFQVEGTFYKTLCRFVDLVKLSLLWILFSLPIVTIGISTVAAMTVALKMVDDEEGYFFKSFLRAFVDNWKQGGILGVLTLIGGYAAYLDFQLFSAAPGNPVGFLLAGILIVFLMVIVLLYAYPLTARYQNTLSGILQNAIRISGQYFGRTILMIISVWLESMLFCINETMLFLAIFLEPGLIIYTVAAFSKRTFQKIEQENKSCAS